MSENCRDLWEFGVFLKDEYFCETISNEAVNLISKSDIESDCEMSLKSDFTMEKLKGSENFYDWLFQMENYLAMKGHANCIIKNSEKTTMIRTVKVETLLFSLLFNYKHFFEFFTD